MGCHNQLDDGCLQGEIPRRCFTLAANLLVAGHSDRILHERFAMKLDSIRRAVRAKGLTPASVVPEASAGEWKIGRASCRERVSSVV